ncbi:DNA-3-methyladenine glycosylase (3mg) [Methanocella conradii HZ254]|uniref:Putative 3-methyladenine DNA glycosylase n=1 Tax=Methanocella conradii (strain DSM 24694 / JCM 17849 / CGMCC 1.5162 / HZ254) TaxID=1041930 RepID=H8I6U4_METCZ|nr:DNA-3-methyladenine glycosylase [Methanocella conradii]AFC99414.1 DNA-3-methyladenine glycosylase (3mg) [Methanocella conradii HZ254]
MTPLPRGFYDRDTIEVAKELLGKVLVREAPAGRMAIKIVETEAYVGPHDKACHASKGMTERNRVMFGEPGHAYVYFIYGMYHCLNIVTEREGYPAAVLIRAGEPLEGVDAMWSMRKKARKMEDLASGPGRLCMAMDIDRSLNGVDMCKKGPLYVEDGKAESFDIVSCRRVGVEYAGEYRDKPWRFYIRDSPSVSVFTTEDAEADNHHRGHRGHRGIKPQRTQRLIITTENAEDSYILKRACIP